MLVLLPLGTANAYTIDDLYVGADDHGHGDVIGESSKFEIFGVDVSLSGTDLTVDVYTNLGAGSGLGSYPGYTYGDTGIGYGDLLLASAWNPFGTGPSYILDDNSNGTIWEYGFAVDNRWSPTGGSGTLYRLNSGNNNADLMLTQDFIHSATYRTGQEVAVDIAANVTSIGTGTWTVTDAVGDPAKFKVSYQFDIAGTTLASSDELALHWAMTCGNDTFEGSYDVPEPASLILCALGLFGLALITLRRRQAIRIE